MDFWRTVVVLLRRWYIAIPAFFGALALAGLAYSAVPVTYQSSSILVLTTPLGGGTESPDAAMPNALTNPLMNFDRSLSLTASIVIQQMNTAETATALGLFPGDPVTYIATNGSTNPELLESGPLIFIQGTGPSPQAAQDITSKASEKAVEILAQRQAELKAPRATQITVQEVVPTTAGQRLRSNAKRAAAAAGALAVLASLAAVYGFESFATSRRRQRMAREADLGPDRDLRGSGGAPRSHPGTADQLSRRAGSATSTTPARVGTQATVGLVEPPDVRRRRPQRSGSRRQAGAEER